MLREASFPFPTTCLFSPFAFHPQVRPKLGKIDIDYQKLHDAFFKWQTKPKMTIHGDLYYEGKEFETRLKEKKPGGRRGFMGVKRSHGRYRSFINAIRRLNESPCPFVRPSVRPQVQHYFRLRKVTVF